MHDQPKQGRVRGVELFQAGIRKGEPYFPHQLDEAVANFKLFSMGPDKLVDPPVKIGHEEDQELLRNTGIPRAGDISNIYVSRRTCEKCGGTAMHEGKECPWCDNHDGKANGQRTILMGDFEKVPLKIADVVRRGAYNRISAEFYRHKPPEGVPAQGLVFRAAALMGGDLPQVKTLKPLLDADWYGEMKPDGYTVCFAESVELESGVVACMSEVVMTEPKGKKSTSADIESGRAMTATTEARAYKTPASHLHAAHLHDLAALHARQSGDQSGMHAHHSSYAAHHRAEAAKAETMADEPKASTDHKMEAHRLAHESTVKEHGTTMGPAAENHYKTQYLHHLERLRQSDPKKMADDIASFPEGTRVEKCVQKLKGRPGINSYAVCQASTHQNLHTGKPITHAELHSHLKGMGFKMDDDFDDDGVIMHGTMKEIRERLEHGKHEYCGQGEFSHQGIGKFNVSCYDDKHQPVKFDGGMDAIRDTASSATGGMIGGTSLGSGISGAATSAVNAAGSAAGGKTMSDATETVLTAPHHTPPGHERSHIEPSHVLHEHLQKHGLHTTIADDGSVSIHHMHKDVHSALTKSGHVHLGTKKADVGSGETHAYRHPVHGMFHVHTVGKGVGQAVYATRGQSASTFGENSEDKRNGETALATAVPETVVFSDMHDHLARHLGKHGLACTRPMGEGIECDKGMKHVIAHLTSKEGGHHKHHGTFHAHDGEKHEIMSHPEHGHFHLSYHEGKVHAHPGRPHNFSEDKLISDTESTMTKEEMKSMFSEVAGELIQAAVADIRKDFTPITSDVDSFKKAMKRDKIEVFVEHHSKPNKNGETRVQAWEMDGTSGLPTLVDELMMLDDKTPAIKFSEGNNSEVLLTPLEAAMKKISLRPARKFNEQVKSVGVSGQSPLDQDKADYEAFCEEAGPSGVGDKAAVWAVLEKMPVEDRKKEIRKLRKYVEASKAGV